nr:MAG TPA: hypothetical protein [Caudoviricetes sp.]
MFSQNISAIIEQNLPLVALSSIIEPLSNFII